MGPRAGELAQHRWLAARGSLLVGVGGGFDSALLVVAACDVFGSGNVFAVIERMPSDTSTRKRA